MNRIIITDCDHKDQKQEDKVIHGAGLTYTKFQCRTEEDLITQCKGAEIMINQYAPFTRKVMEALLPELKLIVRYGVGVDNVDLEAATDLGVIVCNVPDYSMNEVADHAAAMALALLRKIAYMNERTKSGTWDYIQSIPLHRIANLTIGLVGFGRIGRMFARRMKGFGCRIIACDPFFPPGQVIDEVELVSRDDLIEQSDLISIHCPLSDFSRNMFVRETFCSMKNSALLVNTARGGIVNEKDLYEALVTGEIAGAALDVVEKEPFNDAYGLSKLDNFLVTPHMSWYSEEASDELNRKVAEEAVRFIQGEELHYPLNLKK